MAEVAKAVGTWIVENLGWTAIIILFVLSCIFKIAKKEIDPLGWVLGIFGRALTRDVRKDIASLKSDTTSQFEKIKKDRADKIKELRDDYNTQIENLKSDIDAFEKNTNVSLEAMRKGTDSNCKTLQRRLNAMEKSNDLQSIRQIRAHVLDFANSCMNGRKHTVKDFDNIFEENKEYEALIKKYKIKNDRYKEDYEFIVKRYHKHQEENSFLKESDIDG